MSKQKADTYAELKSTMNIRQQHELQQIPTEMPAESTVSDLHRVIKDIQDKLISYQSGMLYLMLKYGSFASNKLIRTPADLQSSVLEISSLLRVSRPFITSGLKDIKGAGYAEVVIESSKGVIITWRNR